MFPHTNEEPETSVISLNETRNSIISNETQSVKLDDWKNISSEKVPRTVSFYEKFPLFSSNNIEQNVVGSYLESVALQNRGLVVIQDFNIILRKDHEVMTDKVKILTGGATGLEPLHSGLIGPGMSTGAVFGDVNSSPPYFNIVVALRVLGKDHTQGILVLVMNNLADRLNFGLACQKAAQEGIKCLCLTIGDDCAVVDSGPVGKRGSSGIVFLLKIAGAMSEEEKSLYEIYRLMNSLNAGYLRSVNITLEPDVLSVGTGLKGGPGIEVESVCDATKEAIFLFFSSDAPSPMFIEKEENIAVIINNFGELSDFDFNLIVREVLGVIHSECINVVRVYIGRFLSNTVSKGFSISVLKINDNLLKCLDYPVSIAIWSNRGNTGAGISSAQDWFSYCNTLALTDTGAFAFEDGFKDKNLGPKFTPVQAANVVKVLINIIDHISGAEEHLNELDADFDYGTTINKFMRGIKGEMDIKMLNIVSPYGLLNNLAEIAAASMGGVSGAVFSVLCASAAQAFLENSKQTAVRWENWISASRMAREGIKAYTHVRPGDRTIMDALHPFVETFTTPTLGCLREAVTAAMTGAELTATMTPLTVAQPDPGAWFLAESLQVMLDQLEAAFNEVDEGDPDITLVSEPRTSGSGEDSFN